MTARSTTKTSSTNAAAAEALAAARTAHAAKTASAKPTPAKPRAPKTPVAEAVVSQAAPESIGADEEVAHSAFEDFSRMFADFKMPSGKRMLCSVVTQFFVIASGTYSGFQVAAMLGLGAVALTGSAFLAFVAYFVAAALGIYASLIAAARIGRYIALGEIDQDVARAKSWISAKFSGLKARLPGRDAAVQGEQHA